jgi:anti-sigma factor RsiW
MTHFDPPVGEDDIQALIDGRLDPERRRVVEARLAADAAAAQRVAQDRANRDALRDRLQFKADEPIPARLRIANVRAQVGRRRVRRLTSVAAAACWLALGIGIGWYASHSTAFVPQAGAVVASDAIAAHRTFVVETAHPVEVDASRQAHLLQWISNRLGRQVAVPDLSGTGFRLMGGRVLPAADGPAAQLMYDDDRGTRLTIYLRIDRQDGAKMQYAQESGISTCYWANQGLGYAVSAATDQARLTRVADAVRDQVTAR